MTSATQNGGFKVGHGAPLDPNGARQEKRATLRPTARQERDGASRDRGADERDRPLTTIHRFDSHRPSLTIHRPSFDLIIVPCARRVADSHVRAARPRKCCILHLAIYSASRAD